MTYDLGIIGGGPAGYLAAERAGHKGLRVILFDKKELGGVCLNEGCIPTKTLLYSAKTYQNALNASKYGVRTENTAFDFAYMMNRKAKVVKKLVAGIKAQMKANHVEVVMNEAFIKGRDPEGIALTAGEQAFTVKNLLIATGSEPFIPPIPGIESSGYLTNREILDIHEVPESLNIIGGGVIGIEFADFFASLGTQVNVFEMLPEILPGMDAEIAAMLRKELIAKGVNFHLGTRVSSVEGSTILWQRDSESGHTKASKLLLSVGRRPVISGFGLENIGVEIERGAIKIDAHCRTNIPNVYAAGDVKGFSMLAHTAYREGEVVVNRLTGSDDRMRYQAIPGVIYTNPEIASVGLTEEAARKQGIEVRTIQLPMAFAGRFVAENEGKNGLCKVVVGKTYEEVLGVHMLGTPSSEMIYGACMAIEMQLRLKDLQQVVFPHPTVSEIFRETCFL